MYVCEYCGRHLKKKYDKCPACGGGAFYKIQDVGEEIIKEPPQYGYKVNLKNYKYERTGYKPFVIILLIVLSIELIFCTYFIRIGLTWSNYIFLGAGIFFLVVPIIATLKLFERLNKTIKHYAKDIRRIKYLSKHGMLIKNLKYKIKPITKDIQGSKTVYKIQVIYEIEKGKTKCFESEPKYLTALGREDGTVDLLIDPNDYTNYFIDFEIY